MDMIAWTSIDAIGSSQLNTAFRHFDNGNLYRPLRAKGTSKYSHHTDDHQWALELTDIKLFLCIVFSLLWPGSINATLLDTSVACDQSNFMLTLNFDTPFYGLVYSEEGFPNCVYVNGTMLSHSSYQLKIPLIGCETRVNVDGYYENAIIIQENEVFLQSTDKKYLLTCIPSMPITMAVLSTESSSLLLSTTTNTITSLTIATKQSLAFNANNEVTTQAFDEHQDAIAEGTDISEKHDAEATLKYSVEIRNGHRLNAPPLRAALNIGDPIAYMVRLQKPVADSQVGRCWASDSRSRLELSDENGCPLQPRAHIWGTFERAESAREVIFINRIKAWAFPTSNEVNIFCNLRICMSRACSFGNCTAINFRVSAPIVERQKNDDDDESIMDENGLPRQRPLLQHVDSTGSDSSDLVDLRTGPEKLSPFWRGRMRRQNGAVLLSSQTHAAPILTINALSYLASLNVQRPIQPINRQPVHPAPIETFSKHLLTENNIPVDELSTTRQLLSTVTAVHFDDGVGELTEIETLATQLRFRRQSIQRAHISDTSLITVNDIDNELPTFNVKETPAFVEWQRHRESLSPTVNNTIINSRDIAVHSQLHETDAFRTELPDPSLMPAIPRETFSPATWRVTVVSAFLVLFSAAFVTFFILWPQRFFLCRPPSNG